MCSDAYMFCFKITISKQQMKVLALLHPVNLLQPVLPLHSGLKFMPHLIRWTVNFKLYQQKQLRMGFVFLDNDSHLQLQLSIDNSAVIRNLIEKRECFYFLFLSVKSSAKFFAWGNCSIQLKTNNSSIPSTLKILSSSENPMRFTEN